MVPVRSRDTPPTTASKRGPTQQVREGPRLLHVRVVTLRPSWHYKYPFPTGHRRISATYNPINDYILITVSPNHLHSFVGVKKSGPPSLPAGFLAKSAISYILGAGAGWFLISKRLRAWQSSFPPHAPSSAELSARRARMTLSPGTARRTSGCTRPPRPARLRTSRRAARRSVGARADGGPHRTR